MSVFILKRSRITQVSGTRVSQDGLPAKLRLLELKPASSSVANGRYGWSTCSRVRRKEPNPEVDIHVRTRVKSLALAADDHQFQPPLGNTDSVSFVL